MEKHVSDENLLKIVELYNSGFKAVKGIASMLELDNSSVYRALQYATKNGMCKYDKNAWKEQTYGDIFKSSKKVLCINSNITYESMSKASMVTGCSRNAIADCCKGKRENIKSRYDDKLYQFKYI